MLVFQVRSRVKFSFQSLLGHLESPGNLVLIASSGDLSFEGLFNLQDQEQISSSIFLLSRSFFIPMQQDKLHHLAYNVDTVN